MDIFEGQFDFVTFKGNIHSYDPGIAKSGLVWTRAVPNNSVKVHLGEKKASYKLADVPLKDSVIIPDAFKQGPSVPATVSFEIHWSGGDKFVKESDATNGFSGKFLEDSATMAWSVKQKGFEFVSDPAKTSTTTFAEIGFERNGVFFNEDDEDDDGE
jgi:hypothetical protein